MDISSNGEDGFSRLKNEIYRTTVRLREQSDGKYSPETDPALKEVISDPVKDALPCSCSAIETWLTCPFKYFLMLP